MEMQPTTPGPPSNDSLVTDIYWRKSWWNGRACAPVRLALRDGILAMASDGVTVFSAAVGSISARITRFTTLVVEVEGVRYAFVGRGSGISAATPSDSVLGPTTPGAATPGAPGLQGAGGVGKVVGVTQSNTLIMQWGRALIDAGVSL